MPVYRDVNSSGSQLGRCGEELALYGGTESLTGGLGCTVTVIFWTLPVYAFAVAWASRSRQCASSLVFASPGPLMCVVR